MSQVVLIVTGRMEREALKGSLERYFPFVDFEVVWVPGPKDERDLLGFTSTRMPVSASDRESNIVQLVGKLASEVEPGRTRERPQIAVLVEDLELCNRDQPQAVLEEVRTAVGTHLAELRAGRNSRWCDRVETALRERASFHLLAPMPEAYFFGDPSALTNAGAQSSPTLVANTLLEDLEIDAVAASSYISSARRVLMTQHPWAANPAAVAARHPKNYVRYLSNGEYKETRHGAAALKGIDWPLIAGVDPIPYARAMFEDIADALGVSLPWSTSGSTALTSLLSIPLASDRLLRNI